MQPAVCDLARHFVLKGAEQFPRIPFVLGDAVSLPFADGAFDGVLCLRNLIYVKDLPEALSEIRRVLGPGGKFCLIDRNRHSPLHQWKYRRGVYNATIGEFEHYFTLGPLLRAMRGAGLAVRRVTGDHLCVPGLFPIPSLQRPGARRAASRLLARVLPRFSFYLVLHAERER
jgi:ubiquinone/menaquinone biosynthesis C-methylase UbiE